MGKKAAAPIRGSYGIKFSSTSKLMLGAFIFLAIASGALLTNGILPKSTLTNPGDNGGDYEIVQDPPLSGQKGLQLRTIKFKACAKKAAVGLLVDRSGSMQFGDKMVNLKKALTTFTSKLSGDSILGMVSFSSNNNGYTAVREDLPFGKYKDNKTQAASAIGALRPEAGTNTRTGLVFVKDKILAAKTTYPDNSFVLIMLSDGIPETFPADCTSGRSARSKDGNNRCFANSQDPTRDPNVADEIKATGIKIYTIAVYDPTDPSDIYFLPDMRSMMQKIASPDSYFETPDSTQLTSIYNKITTRLCNDIK